MGEYDLFAFLQPSPNGFVIKANSRRDFCYGIAVHQSHKQHFAIRLIVDVIDNKRLDLLIAVIRALVNSRHFATVPR